MRLRDTPSAILLVVLMLISGNRLYSTGWTAGFGTVLVFCLFGSILGILLGWSRYNRLITFLLGLGYSLAVVPLITLSGMYENLAWGHRLAALSNQLVISFIQLVTNQPVPDPTLFLVFAYVGYWFLSLTAAYMLARYGKFAAAVVPAGVVMLIIQLFDMHEADPVYILAVYVFLSLLLLGRLSYVRRRSQWKEERIWVSSDAVTDLNLLIGASALVLVVLVWIAPVSGHPVTSARIAWENLTRPWRNRQEDLNKTIQSLQSQQVRTIDIYGDSLPLGRQAETSPDTFMTVQVPLIVSSTRYYWRVRSYDLYQNDEWFTDYSYDEPFIPSEGSLAIADPQGVSAEFSFRMPGQNISTLVTPARPIWTNRYSRLTFTPSTQGKIDPLMFVSGSTILAGQDYLVHADIYQPTVDQLRSAGEAYPGWVTSHYLEVPDNLSPEIGNLARQITAGLQTPYDKATAITDYLRKNITYTTAVGTPPPGRDVLSWFLFDTKTGFCNYYATAEVILLRSVGIPARIVVGYAQGKYEAPNKYVVLQKDAHAWPEVYFPDNGWVEFEPTVSQAPLVRPAGGANAGQTPTPTPAGVLGLNGQNTPIPLGAGGPSSGVGKDTLLRLGLFLIVLGILIAAYFFGFLDNFIAYFRRTFDRPAPIILKGGVESLGLNPPPWLNRWAFLAGLNPAERAFHSIYQSLFWLGTKTSPARTPAEAAAILGASVPEASQEIQALLQQYQLSLYSLEPADLVVARRAAEAVRRLSIRAAIRARIKAFRGIFKEGFRSRQRHDAG